MAWSQFPSILMVMLCTRCALGGAEKRYARVFEMLVAQTDGQHRLLINRAMLDLLQWAGILLSHESHLIVLESPFHRFTQSKGEKRRLLFRLVQPLDVLWYMWQCWKAIRHYRPDIVHPLLTGMYLSLPGLVVSPAVRHVLSAYSPKFEPESIRSKGSLGIKLGTIIKQYAMQRCRAIDALSLSIRDQLIARGIDGDKIQIAPCSFTDFSLCKPDPQKKKWVVFLARFIAEKNPLLLAEAVPKVLARVPDVHFYFLGRGYLQERLGALLQDSHTVDHVTIKFEPQPTSILNQSSVFASLQTEENYPSQSLLEAMACGNAIVATDVGETWRLVDEANGVRVPPTVDAVAEAIISLLENSKLPQLGHASRQRALAEHTPERFFDYITNLYRTAATGLPT